eukprot:TRINITY_DN12008_c0_g2_i1.p1 TRINITY_DN12008_c0_g2~~TRINITY_DN12008_c0_g2_i1.p1  ORF type:complete len:470 (+),score=96.43 TRINITY_DN12008_c0_g2_i1:113-1522(+)
MPEPNSGDQSFMAISSALVLLMTPGLAFFYGGMVREKNILNTMMMSLISMGIISFLWMLFGFSIAFTWSTQYVCLSGLTDMIWPATTISGLLFAIYQMTFAIITAAIISGAIVERVNFKAYIVLISIWMCVVYLPLCNWVWGGGWIFQIGAKDFAGGTVVHISSGTSAYVCASILGRRKMTTSQPHNIPFVVLGGSLLWFGWTGFNGGSALAASDLAGLAIATTFIAAACGLIAWGAAEVLTGVQPSAMGAMSGVVAGLVGITPVAGFVTPVGSVFVGIITAFVCFGAVKFLARNSQVDDSLECFAVHGVGGYTGAILGGLFDKDQGIFYGHSTDLLVAQFIGASSGMIFCAVATFIIFSFLNCIMRVRVEEHEEAEGVDQWAHKEEAYKGDNPTASGVFNSRGLETGGYSVMSSANQQTYAMAPTSPVNSQKQMLSMMCCAADNYDESRVVVANNFQTTLVPGPGLQR